MNKKRKKIVFLTGAGISAESGISTFRDKNGLWENHRVEDVATPEGWKKDKQKVLDFYNKRRSELSLVNPNSAHKIISDLESEFDITIITQNVDNLHERAGSTNVVHLHGELTKSRSTLDSELIFDCFDDIKIGDKCPKGSQLRPHIVWFGEMLDSGNLEYCRRVSSLADIFVIVGTSMQVAPANLLPFSTKEDCLIYYIDPSNIEFSVPKSRRIFFYHFQETASVGLVRLKDDLRHIYLD